jgi:acyl dehydratase
MTATQHIGFKTAPTKIVVDPWRVKLFGEAIGETDPVYSDDAAARAAGHKACLVPPTFLKALESEHCGSAVLLELLGIPMRRVLHVEQGFTLLAPVHVGDEVEISREITDLYDKRAGALSFIVVRTRFQIDGALVCESVQTLMARNELAA